MVNRSIISFLLFSFVSVAVFSQAEYSGEVNLSGMVSSQDNLPFWMHHNKRGRILENTNVAGWVSGKAIFETGFYSSLEIGAGGLVRDNEGDEFAVDEAYAHFQTEDLYITAGIKHQEELYNGLSASNRSILWSLNSRAIPGLQIGTNK
ncbi:hypothetical protein LZ575_12665 [Antarcticibacterium sp. 1MA-6-2]|uniref:hypothetical protein n=1 Tax=Antarcticibacterium sp. 1MA-6-2 TaxID=2908210 RepID=UPI001F362D81|nr:hypothetical protein [Antarcticibacterium sp. 1MA-6-2]UJH89852.1 hypothetical protein LZ575_12665 [Antarcticibacterium sp. 1MA-6-2]